MEELESEATIQTEIFNMIDDSIDSENFVKELFSYNKKLFIEKAIYLKSKKILKKNLSNEYYETIKPLLKMKGIPDFLIFNKLTKELMFVEVKTENTGLSSYQIEWITNAYQKGIIIKLIYIKRLLKGEIKNE